MQFKGTNVTICTEVGKGKYPRSNCLKSFFTEGKEKQLKCLTTFFFSKKTSLAMALTFVRGPKQLSAFAPRLAPLLSFSVLLDIETALPEIETTLPA